MQQLNLCIVGATARSCLRQYLMLWLCSALLLVSEWAVAGGLTVATERLEESTYGNRTAFYLLVDNRSDELQRVDLTGFDERWQTSARLQFPQRQLWVPAGQQRRALVVVTDLAAGQETTSYACITPLPGRGERICTELIAIRFEVESALRRHVAYWPSEPADASSAAAPLAGAADG